MAASAVRNPLEPPAARPTLRRPARVVRFLSLACLVVIAGTTAVLWGVSEDTWWGTVFTFMPHLPFVVAPIVLLPCALVMHRRSVAFNLIALVVAAGPLAGLRLGLAAAWGTPAAPGGITVVSCNVQQFSPDFRSLIREIAAKKPDVVALQEALADHNLLARTFPDWHTLHEDEFWIGSRFPLKRLDSFHSAEFRHRTVLSVQIDGPAGPFVLHNVHLTTPRFGFLRLSVGSILDGSGPRRVEESTTGRYNEAVETRAYINRIAAAASTALPTLIVGDFNAPTSSSLYRTAWDGYTSAFDAVGRGFGFTVPCTPHRFWIDYWPWVRIDHILMDDGFRPSACGVGRGIGSDHRLIWAKLSRS